VVDLEEPKMDRSKIILELRGKYSEFIEFIESMSELDFTFSFNGEKWTAGQQADHLFRSLTPLNKGLSAPEFVLKTMFGKADHPSVSYDELVARYCEAIAPGVVAPDAYKPDAIAFEQRGKLISELRKQTERLCTNVEKFDESRLDTLVLPHPLLGKLTLREMLYFTIYHAEHHRLNIARSLRQAKLEVS
jgi:hypothetical protein